MQAFNGAVLFTISPYNFDFVLKPIKVKQSGDGSVKRVSKTDMAIESIKWRYMYETGRLVWEKSDVDLARLQDLIETKPNGNVPEGDDSDDEGKRSQQFSGAFESQGTPQSATTATSTMSERRRGKMRVPKNNDQNNVEGISTRSDNVTHLPEDRSIFTLDPKPQKTEEKLNLEVFQKSEQNSLDGIWSSLRDDAIQNKWKGEMAKNIMAIERREQDLACRRLNAFGSSENAPLTAELVELERSVAADRLRLLQRIANGSAAQWRVECVEVLNRGLYARQNRRVDKHEIKTWLMNLLLSPRDNDSSRRRILLEMEEIQTVIDLVDNLELSRECTDRIQDGVTHGTDVEELVGLENVRASLDVERQTYTSQLANAMFKNHGHCDINLLMIPTVRLGDLNDEELSPIQDVVVANVMEALNCQDKALVTRLLKEAGWNAEEALTKWCHRDLGNDAKATLPTRTAGKRPHEAEAGPSSSKRQKKSPSREMSPEETLEDAQVRLNRILSGGGSAD